VRITRGDQRQRQGRTSRLVRPWEKTARVEGSIPITTLWMILPDPGMPVSVHLAMSTIYGIKQIQISGWSPLRWTCRKRGEDSAPASLAVCHSWP
jgi:hypothetical protein